MNAAASAASDRSGASEALTPWRIMRPVRGRIRLAMALSSISAVLALVALGLLAWALHALSMRPGEWPSAPLLTAGVCVSVSLGLRLAAFSVSHLAAFKLESVLRTDLSTHLAKVSMGHIDDYGPAALAKVMQDDVKALHIFVADSTPLYARAFVMPVATLALLLWLDWRLALGALAVLVFGFAVLALAMRDGGEMMRRYNLAREHVSAAVVEFVQAMPVVRTFDSGHATFGRYQRALRHYRRVVSTWYRRSAFASRFSMAVLNPLPTLVVLCGLGAALWWHEALAWPTWIAALLICTGMAEAMMPLMSLRHLVNKAQMSVARIQEVLSLPVLPQPPVEAAPRRWPADAGVRFENVTFRYGEHGEPREQGGQDSPRGRGAAALQDIDFEARPGSVTALVGPSGAGKTTVARLIPRFWDVSGGRVLIGGVDVRELPAHVLMRQVGFVFQDTFLFAGSLADNIRLGMPEASHQAVVAAARAAQAHDFIMALPQGYDTLAGERGLHLSGGQRQRITIARAILHDRPILVLDEATAFADPENEAALMRALAELMRGKTVIMIAHRLTTVRDADQILVFERGRIVERGRHAALLDAAGCYARLWRNHEAACTWALGRPAKAEGASHGI